MAEAQEMSIIHSIMEDIIALKKKIEDMEERLQALAYLHSESELEIKAEYLEYLDQMEEKGEFEDFSDIEDLRKRIENVEC